VSNGEKRRIEHLSAVLAGELQRIACDNKISLADDHREYLRLVTESELADGLNTMRLIREKIGNDRIHLFISGLGNSFRRLLCMAVRRCGGKVTTFTHGGNVGFYNLPDHAFGAFAVSDTFVTYNRQSALLFKETRDAYPALKGNVPDIVSAEYDLYLRMHRKLKRRPLSRRIRRMMIIGFTHNNIRKSYLAGCFSLMQLDAELQTVDILSKAGYRVLYKAHPDRLREVSGIFEDRTEVLTTPFEKNLDAADAYVFTGMETTTFVAALCTRKPVIILRLCDAPYEPIPAAMELIKKRCYIVQNRFDVSNRIVVNKEQLLEAVSRMPKEPNNEFIERYLFPERGKRNKAGHPIAKPSSQKKPSAKVSDAQIYSAPSFDAKGDVNKDFTALRILVTGGAGYIGSHVTQLMLSEGHRVTVIDPLWFKQDVSVHCSNPRYKFLRGSICDKVLLDKVMRDGIDYIIHTAAVVGDPACKKFPKLAYQTNYEASVRLISTALEYGAKGLIFFSTCSNYGISEGVATEQTPLKPLSVYAQTKVDIERYLMDKTNGLDSIICRLSTVYGVSRRMRFDLTVNDFVLNAYMKKYLDIFLPFTYRPYIHVADIAGIVGAMIADFKRLKNNIYNVGFNEENYQKIRIAEIVRGFVPETLIKISKYGDDLRDYRVDFSKLRRSLSFTNKFTVTSGVQEVLALLKRGLITDPYQSCYYNTTPDLEGAYV